MGVTAGRLALPVLLLLGFAAAGPLHDQLGMFFELGPQDSVVSLTKKSPTLLAVDLIDPATGDQGTLEEEGGAKPMARLLAEAAETGVSVKIPMPPPRNDTGPAAAGNAPSSPGSGDTASPAASARRSISSPRKNRMWYIATQSALSTYVYGVSIPLALDVDSWRVQVATPLLTAPFAFGAHFYFAKDRVFEDSHRKGTFYLSIASLFASYALPFSLMEWDDNPYRVASFASLAAYPLGIWGGYLLGDHYVDQPGRIDTQAKFALGFGLMGFFSPFLYFENVNKRSETIFRLGLGQSVAFATAGHFLASHYRAGENIPEGVNTGILNHTALGALLGVEVAALADASSVRPWLGAALSGGTLGFMEGLFYYRNRYDSKERGLYNTLGAVGGALMGLGVWFLASGDQDEGYEAKVKTASMLVGGTWLGYWGTNILTMGMEDRTGNRSDESWSDRLSVNLIPFPEPQIRDQALYYRYRLQGVTYRW